MTNIKKTWAIGAIAALSFVIAILARAADAPAPADSPKGVDTSKPTAIDTVTVDEKTDVIIRGALKYLAASQGPTGSWSKSEHQAAMTAYPLMAFLAAGELPGEGEYGKTVTRGMDFLLSCVRPDGYIAASSGQSNMYGHGISTIALAEMYGETKDPKIRPGLEKAVKLIISCQNDKGGWRYNPRRADADISVTVLQVVALRAAKNAGLDVPQETIDRAVSYVKSCHDARTGGFSYQPGSGAGFARTAAAIYSLQVCGLYDDPEVKAGSEYLLEHLKPPENFATYGYFYAAPAQYMLGGDTWKNWYKDMSTLLVPNVLTQPGGIYYWKPIEGDRYPNNEVYATSVYTMILAMPYHYIPLYQR